MILLFYFFSLFVSLGAFAKPLSKASKVSDLPVTAREKCIAGVGQSTPPQIGAADPLNIKCAKNAAEIRSLFPAQFKLIPSLQGHWSDNHVGDYEERVYRFQELAPNNYMKNDQVPLLKIHHGIKIMASSEAFKIQTQDFDERAKLHRTEVMPAELCRGPEGFYFQTSTSSIPVKFQGPQCLWVAMNGIWTAQRVFPDVAVEFDQPVSRLGADKKSLVGSGGTK